MAKIAVVILNYNGKKHLTTFLPSVVRYSKEAEIIVADNASTDDSVSFLSKNYPEISILRNSENLGFAGGYNWALKQVEAEFYILLNSDVEVTENWILPVIELMKENPLIGACQPKIRSFQEKEKFEYAGAAGGYIDWLGYPFCRGRVFDTLETDTGQYDNTHEIFWATGACLFIRSEVFHQQNGFDANFFAHMEEIDLCWRIKNKGLAIYYSSESTVYHLGGGTLNKSNPRKTYLNYRNSLAMLYKNLPPNHIFVNIFYRLILDGVSGVRLFLSGNWAEVWAIIKAHFAFYALMPTLKKQRTKTFSPISHIYPHSIIVQYFLKKNKTFQSLKRITDVENWHNGRYWFG